MTKVTRRQLTHLLTGGLILASLPALTACQGFTPQPFITGRTITPPQGCTELLARDQRGDC
ncbi:hypothetical protein [Oceanicoccus sp. KOV_DT_Chl]|uniref:hypothetical protein n=1 Tax=Oceanicoccus sp. KOV_DT_Chl TaxID=1904639 RepID=UPI000C7AD21F|nr:hypothetical protein [Oceanicoccus sp. KOV_DT_Chl]